MTLPRYDIFKKHEEAVVWVEAALDLESAKKRSEELAKQNCCQYVVFDHRQQQIVARLNVSIS
jgi:hypothetical protein